MLRSHAINLKVGLDDPRLHRDITYLFKKYYKRGIIMDLLANIPITVYWILHGYQVDIERLESL